MRPLLLVQAQNTNAEANVQAVKEHLLEEGVAESAIKIATGEQRELDNLDLMSRETKVDAVITMEALREGWDCSFAYVFCSLCNVTTDTAAEQLLGRVLRMPYASRRRVPELNEAYAFVISNNFAETAQGLKDRLVRDLGFTSEESDQFVCPAPEHGPGLFAKVIDVTRRPNFVGIAPEATRSVRLLQSPDGAWSVELRETVSSEVELRIVAELPADAQGQARARIAEHNRLVTTEHASLPVRRPIAVPQLYVSVGGERCSSPGSSPARKHRFFQATSPCRSRASTIPPRIGDSPSIFSSAGWTSVHSKERSSRSTRRSGNRPTKPLSAGSVVRYAPSV